MLRALLGKTVRSVATPFSSCLGRHKLAKKKRRKSRSSLSSLEGIKKASKRHAVPSLANTEGWKQLQLSRGVEQANHADFEAGVHKKAL